MQRHKGLERLLEKSGVFGDVRGNLLPLAYDGAGRLYAYGQDHVLRSVSVREQLLDDASADPPSEDAQHQQEEGGQLRAAAPEPPLPCAAQQLHINRAGTYALVFGHEQQEDGLPSLHVISLTQREDETDAAVLEDPLLVDRPGLQILQAAWHPGSDAHFAVLASDNVFRLYQVDDMSTPEQQVELRLRERQPLGLMDMEGSHAVSFAFGSPSLWERFSVFFTCSDGKIFLLTPLAPFGCVVPASALHRLHAQTELIDDGAARSCTRAWLQQAFPDLRHGVANGGAAAALDIATCAPAALDEHVPALAGPLPLAAAGEIERTNLLDFLEGDDGDVTSSAVLGGSVTCLAVGTADGALGLLVLADVVEPRWAAQPPQVSLDASGAITRTRLQSTRQADGAPRLLLLDVVRLEAGQAHSPQPAAASSPPLRLLPSPADAECLYAALPHGVLAVKVPWLPRIAALARGCSADDGDKGAALPTTVLEEVCSASSALAGVAVIGDTLLGAAVAAVEVTGRALCRAPAAGGLAAGALSSRATDAAATDHDSAPNAQAEAAVAERFAQLLKGPPPPTGPSPLGPRYAGTPEGQRALAEATASLRERHVEFSHTAHHDLLQHAKRLQGNAAEQAAQLAALRRQAARLQAAARDREQQLERVTQFNGNLAARFRLLASLHFSLPQPLSAAEAAFASRELPTLERISADLRRKCQDAGVQWAAAAAPAVPAHLAGTLQRQPSAVAAMPAAQMRKVREALSDDASLIAANRAKAEAIAECLASGF